MFEMTVNSLSWTYNVNVRTWKPKMLSSTFLEGEEKVRMHMKAEDKKY